ncbi:MAG: acetyl-CoA acetyltransferase [Actinomycetota bacterium]
MSGRPYWNPASIVGVGLVDGRGEVPGNHLDQLGVAVHRALDDAGLSITDVDGLFTANLVNFLPALTTTEYLGVRPKVYSGSNTGGNAFVDHLLWAGLALASGQCEVALVCYGSNQRSGRTGSMPPDRWPYQDAYSPMEPISSYALAAARHMHEFGTTREQLAEVAVAARQWAQLNPEAVMQDDLSIADVLSARIVASPLSLLDCCLVTDGAGAVVLTTPERARNLRNMPVNVAGVATEMTHHQISQAPSLVSTGAAESGRRALEMAGIGIGDVDVVQLYDAFTINVILFLEDLGFCKKGEGGAFVEGGRIAPGGDLAVNTNGGGLSCMHPGMYGVFLLIEAVRQLRGQAGERQVSGAETALCHGNGGLLSAQSTAVLVRGA